MDADDFLDKDTIYFAIDPIHSRCDYMWRVNPKDHDEMPYIAQQLVAQMFTLDESSGEDLSA